MKKYLDLLSENVLFQNLPKDTILQIIESEACHIKNFPAGKIIYEIGQHIRHIGIVLEGIVDIVHLSPYGHDTIVSRIAPGGIFGESFSCAEAANFFNETRSIQATAILFIDVHALLHQARALTEYHLNLIENILRTLAKSNVWLNTKIQILNQKTLRDKILTYFETLAAKNNSNTFTIPFNREQLASFLGSERSSVSRELSKMQEEQILTIRKDYVTIHNYIYKK